MGKNGLSISLIELLDMQLFKRENISRTGVNILHAEENEEKVRRFWSSQLKIPLEKVRYYNDDTKTSEFEVCHIYISDVLLRRVVDELNNKIMKKSWGVLTPQ